MLAVWLVDVQSQSDSGFETQVDEPAVEHIKWYLQIACLN